MNTLLGKTTAIWHRVSTSQQNLDTGINELKEFCERKGWQNVEVYSQKVSAVKKGVKSQEWERLIQDCNNAKIQRVVCIDLSRISRKGIKDTMDKIDFFLQHDIALYDKMFNLDFSGEMGKLIASVFACFNSIEVQNRREKQMEALRQIKDSGKLTWNDKQKRFHDSVVYEAVKRHRDAGLSVRKTAKLVGCSVSTVQRAIKYWKSNL